MKQYFILKSLFVLMIVLFSTSVFAQNDADSLLMQKRVVVKMKSGDEFTGYFLNKHGDFISIRTINGDMQLIAKNVESILESKYRGRYSFDNPLPSRYFFGPSAIPLEKGKGYYQNVFLSTNFVNVGITDNISVGGGVELLTLMMGVPVWFFTPKIAFEVADKVHVGAGLLTLGVSGFGAFNLAYGVGTYGSSESNVSFGLGYGFAFGEVSSSPAILVGGTHRLGKSFSVLSENYILTGAGDLGVFGIEGFRILSQKSSFDIGLMVTPELITAGFGIPFVGYARTF
jgi:hypothetical protein